jgi:flavin-dependent dehydrogenase
MTEVVILGGGPAGAAAAITLARAGRRPLLLERDAAPREKVCGEFMAADAAAQLARLGISLPGLGAVPIGRSMLGAGRRSGEVRLPFAAWGLPRARLDAALLDAAEDAGAELRLGTAVVAAERAGAGWRIRLGTGEVLAAENIVLATGKHECRGLSRGAPGGALGLKLHLSGMAPEGAVLLLACGGGYAGLQPRPGGGMNLCAALRPDAAGVPEAARDAHAFLAHVAAGSALAERVLAGAAPLWPRPLAVAGVPYGWLHRAGQEPAPFRVGDQLAVIPSLCGDGVAIALASGAGAAAALLAGDAPARHHMAWRRRLRLPMRVAGMVGLAVARAPGLAAGAALSAPRLAASLARLTRAG